MKFPAGYFDRLIAIVRRDAPTTVVDQEKLAGRIESLLAAVAAPHTDDEQITYFREAVDAQPTDKELADCFKKIAKAENPFASEICLMDALVLLNIRAKELWAERLKQAPLNRKHLLLKVSWDELINWQQVSVRKMARELEKEYRQKVMVGAPGKTDQNALLMELANIYLSMTGEQIDRFELPHSVGSHFISFVHTAVEPFYPNTEVTLKALSNRWHEMKLHNMKKSEPIKAVLKTVRIRPKYKT